MHHTRNPAAVVALLTALASSVASGQAPSQNDTHPISEVTLDNTKEPLLPQLAAAVKKASDQGLTPVADVGASWCEPCHVVDDIIHRPSMKATMAKMYVIHLDLEIWSDPLQKMGADVTTGIPRVFALDHTGRPTGEPWRPRDIPDSLQQKGTDESFRLSLIDYFKKARAQFAQSQPAKSSQSGKQIN